MRSSVFLEFPFFNFIQIAYVWIFFNIAIVPAKKLIKEVVNDDACAFLHNKKEEFFNPRLLSFFLFLLFIGHCGFSVLP